MKNQRVLITGVSSGLGHGLAIEYLRRGFSVLGVSRREPRDLIDAGGERFHFLALDLGSGEIGGETMERWLAEVGGVDLLLLNAGILGRIADLSETSLAEMRHVMEVNLWANKWVIDAVLRQGMLPRQVVAISSGASVSGSRGWNAYALSKAALNMLIMLYAAEQPKVHFAALAPGLVDTAMQEYMRGLQDDGRFETLARLRQAHGTPAMKGPEEAARAVAAAIDCLPAWPNGSYVDIRKME